MSRPSLSGATSLGPNQADEPGTPRDAGEGALQDKSGRGSASWGHASRGQAMTLLWASQVSRAAGEMGPRPFRSFIERLDRWAASPDTLFSKATPSTDSSLADGDGTGTGCGLWGADRGRAVEAVRGFSLSLATCQSEPYTSGRPVRGTRRCLVEDGFGGLRLAVSLGRQCVRAPGR